jgi:hypothetical protein
MRISFLSASLLAKLWLVFVAALSLLPLHAKNFLLTTGFLHTYGHIVIFGITGALCCRALYKPLTSVIGGMAVLAFGFCLEFLQWLIYGNRFEWRDLVLDALGITCGLLLLSIAKHVGFLSRAEVGHVSSVTGK